MDAATLKTIEAEIAAAVDTAGNIEDVIAPQYAAFIVLGQAVAKALPGRIDDVQRLLSSQEPTDADVAALAQKIAALPENL